MLFLTAVQVEEAALKKEKDPVSKARLEEVRGELAGLQEQLQPLLARYRAEKHRLEEIRALRKKREDYLVSLPLEISALPNHLLCKCWWRRNPKCSQCCSLRSHSRIDTPVADASLPIPISIRAQLHS